MGVDRDHALVQTFGGDSWVSRFLQTKAVAENGSDVSAFLAHPIPSLSDLCGSARVLPIRTRLPR